MNCCNNEIITKEISPGKWGSYCQICGKKGEGASEIYAVNSMKNSLPVPAIIPKNPKDLTFYVMRKIKELSLITMPFVANDKPAFQAMIAKNIRYIISQKSDKFLQCWKTQEGQESIIHALEECISLGATMPEMGCIVPYGSTVEFIPAVEAYDFALTNGKNSPFDYINIESIFENDIREISITNGEFSCEIKPGIPRGELLAIVVYGKYRKSGKLIGEVYDKERLLKKAKGHSPSYRYYLNDVAQSQLLKSEGKTKSKNGREYFVKQIFKKGGGSYNIDVYLDEMENPYESADQPEMLRKTAGKSFLRKYVRVRSAEAAIEELQQGDKDGEDVDDMIDSAMTSAFNATPGEIKKKTSTPAKKEENIKNANPVDNKKTDNNEELFDSPPDDISGSDIDFKFDEKEIENDDKSEKAKNNNNNKMPSMI